MKLTLDVELAIDVQEGGKSKEKLSIFLREYTKEESKESKKIQGQFQKLLKRATKIGRKQDSLSKQILFNEELGNFEKALSCVNSKDALGDELEELGDEIEALGGDDFAEVIAKKNFELLVSGKGKDNLVEYAEIRGYQFLMTELFKEKRAVEKKQSGE